MNDEATVGNLEEIVYSFARAQWLTGWWAWALAVIVVVGVFYFVYKLYRRDTVEITPITRITLLLLRFSLLLGLVFFLLGIERRARQRITRPSEVAVLVDTSQSMSLPQSDEVGGPSRIQAVTDLVSKTPLVTELAEANRVTVYTFDTTGDLNEVIVSNVDHSTTNRPLPVALVSEQQSSLIAQLGIGLLVCGAIALFAAAALSALGKYTIGAPSLLVGTVFGVVGGVLLTGAWTINSQQSLRSLAGLPVRENAAVEPKPSGENLETEVESFEQRWSKVDWNSVLVAAGTESRIGDAIRSTLQRHDPTTLAGIVLLTDGQNNGGAPPAAAATLVSRSGTAIYPIGFGSALPPTNVRIVDLDAPRRVYPGDRFALNAVLQGSGSQPLKVQVQLLDAMDTSGDATPDASENSADKGATNAGNAEIVDSREVIIPNDGSLLGVHFEMEPAAVGRRRLTIRVVPPAGDQNPKDDVREAQYEVISRRLRVLLVAGGPMREYQFVRNLLFRDSSVEVDVWLQTGQAGMSQDADKMLTSFPSEASELFEYDAIVAFDPNWMALDALQLELLDQWLSQQAGGLILVSGPVYMPEWTRQRTDPRMATVRNFFPVALSTRGPLLSTGRTGGDTAWPLKFTNERDRADFLQLEDDPSVKSDAWEQFGGVYDFVGVKDAKPGAKIYAYFSDPSTAIDEALPIYLASQFYGAGRVFFQGSGEMWRLRGVSDESFDAYYTKLVRWVSEGRLLRDSNRGILLVDRPRAMVGDTITVRAILTDEQFAPLKVSQVDAVLLTPSGRNETVRLTPLAGEPREGTYTGRVLAREAGAYELRITLGNALNEHVLRQSISVGLPTLELERPRRNDEVLRSIAATTGGSYFPYGDIASSSGAPVDPLTLPSLIEPQPQLTILPGTPDREFEERRNASLMWVLCSLLTMEWMIRRLHRLA